MSHAFPIRKLALGCSALALATALAAPAAAQSFQGSANVVFGSANVVQGQTTTNVNVSSQSAVIDWTPSDTATNNGVAINFQPAGTQANFIGQSPTFAVLNRIVPVDTSRPVTFNGTVVSRYIQGQVGFTGGTLFFYSPGGIVVGGSAVFDVGNLGLTSAPPVVDAAGAWYTNNTVQFGQAATSSSVIVNQGARIGASVQGSYVAAFAPYVQHDGAINVNGRAALVAGEAGTVTFSPDGLFDIQVTTGTGRTDGVLNTVINTTGDITGTASGGAGDLRRVYLVAVPKNQLVTMSIQRGTSLGFDIAGAANVQGNAVVLTAGYGVTDGIADTARAGGGGTGAIRIQDSNGDAAGSGVDFTSATRADASDSIFVSAFRQTRFASNAFLRGDTLSQVTVNTLANTPAGSLAVGGNLTLAATRPGNAAASDDAGFAQLNLMNGNRADIGGSLRIDGNASRDINGDGVVTAGSAALNVRNGSTLNVATDLVVTRAAYSDGAVNGPDARGGSGGIMASVNGASTVTVGRVTRVVSEGIAGFNNGTSGQGGDGIGGTSILSVFGGSTFTTRELNVSADGVGGRDIGGGSGTGTGGSAIIQVGSANSVLTVQAPNATGQAALGERDLLSAEALGGFTGRAGGTGGLAQGGSATISVSSGGRLVLPTQANASGAILARAYGGNASGGGSTGGEARAGAVNISVDAATLIGEGLILSSFAQGGGDPQQLATGDVDGGNAVGGSRLISIVNGSVFTGSVTGGGPSGVGGSGSLTGTGGNGRGGTATTSVDASTLNVSARGFLTFTQNTGGGGGAGGDASDGVASTSISNGSTVNLAAGAIFGTSATAFANGQGGQVANVGGNANGGIALLSVLDSTIQGNGTIEVLAPGEAGGDALTGGLGQGGSALFNLTGASVNVASVTVSALGNGTSYVPGGGYVPGVTSGTGIGGQASLALGEGSLLETGNLSINANGEGGRIDAEGVGNMTSGAGTGGSALLSVIDSIVRSDNVTMEANGSGGIFGFVGTGVTSARTGAGIGGSASTFLQNATLAISDSFDIDGVGEGGDVFIGQGTEFVAGDGIGGNASIFVIAGFSSINAGRITIGSDGGGGSISAAGGTGGAGGAGQSRIDVSTDAILNIDVTEELGFSSEGSGGDVTFFDGQVDQYTGTGGAATGGFEAIVATGGSLTVNGAIDFEGDDEGGAGATGGAATGGTTNITAQIGGSITLNGALEVTRETQGGYGLTGGAATGGQSLFQASEGGTLSLTGSLIVGNTALGGFDENTGEGTGGAATAGESSISADNATIQLTGAVSVTVSAQGGRGANGGNALGSLADDNIDAFIVAQNGGAIAIEGETTITTTVSGGLGRAGGQGGSATGGRAQSYATGATIAYNGSVAVAALANGGQGAIGGGANAGTAFLQSAFGGVTTVSGSASVSADAEAGAYLGGTATGGAATGGTARIFATDGSARMDITGSASLSARATGGTGARDAQGSGGPGGAATAGSAGVVAATGSGNLIAIGGDVDFNATANGGQGLSVSGGNATAGRGLIQAIDASSIAIGGGADLIIDAYAGGVGSFAGLDAPAGTRGGDAFGGQATLILSGTGGAVTVAEHLYLSPFAYGGDVDNPVGDGGNGTIGLSQVVAQNGTVTLGSLEADPIAGGGDGVMGGNALAGANAFAARIVARNGSVSVTGSTDLRVLASGGDGSSGGAGGNALAVGTLIDADSSASGAGAITLADVVAASDAQGGAGGDGPAGGRGGSATAGPVQVLGTAGNGTLVVTGFTSATSTAVGGAGGQGSSGAGGAGGEARTSLIQLGTKSGIDTGPINAGSASFADISIDGSASGGAGGGSEAAIGGAGGDAASGGATLLVRGSPVTAGEVNLSATGRGGDGGIGATRGAGGFGAAGAAALIASQRFERSERGTATIDTLNLVATGTGGAGGTLGASYFAGDGGVSITQSDVTIGTLSYVNSGALPPPAQVIEILQPIKLVLSGASLEAGALTMTTPGEFLLDLDNSTLNAGSFAITAGNFVLPTIPPARPGTIVADSLSLTATTGSVRTFAGFDIATTASFVGATLVLGDIATDGAVTARTTAGDLQIGNVAAASATLAAQGGAVTAGDIATTGVTRISASGAITAGNLTASTTELSAGGAIQTGAIATGGPVVARGGGSLTIGALTASAADLEVVGGITIPSARIGGVFRAFSGSAGIAVGTIAAETVQAFAQTGISISTITAARINAGDRRLITVGGAWTAADIDLASLDLEIAPNGSLAAGPGGTIDLLSANPAGAFIGDGLSGTGGYRLSNAEFGRVSGNTIFIGAEDVAANGVDMTIGALTIGSGQLPGADGELEFATGNPETFVPGGRIRVEGAVAGNGFSDTQYLSFSTGSFELNAETGSVALSGTGPGGLGGIVYIDAANIHVAAPTILERLRGDARYPGLAGDLNAPAAVQRPEGVLRALGLELYPSDTLYIQNTGTARSPAGFLATLEASEIEPPGFENAEAQDVDVVINGRFALAAGEIGGVDAFTAVIEAAESFEGFAPSSQINSCAFAADACSAQVGPGDDNGELAVLQSEFELLDGMRLEEDPFDLDQATDEEEDEAEQAARAPIEPPVVLIDTRPLNPPIDIADPVSGSGNPAALAPLPATAAVPPAAPAGDDQ